MTEAVILAVIRKTKENGLCVSFYKYIKYI